MENKFEILNGKTVETITKESNIDESLLTLYAERFQQLDELRRCERVQLRCAELIGIINERIKACESELGETVTAELQKASPHIQTEAIKK